jgi:hypothetical protein
MSGTQSRPTATVHSPDAAAALLGVSRSQLRKLTRTGAIGYVHLGTGSQRAHVGYTDAHLSAFLASREVAPASGPEPGSEAPPARPTRRRRAAAPISAAAVAAEHAARAQTWKPVQ